jgi:uncharacterized protein YkwD
VGTAGGAASSAAAQPAPPPFVASGRGALAYGAPPTAADRAATGEDPLRAAIVEDARAFAGRAGLPLPEGDPRLDQAMNDLARNLRGDDLPALELVSFLLSHYGIVEPSPHLLFARGSPGADQEIRDHTASQVPQIYKMAAGLSSVGRIGVGIDRSAAGISVVVGLLARTIELAPVPRRLPAGGSTGIAGQLVGQHQSPQLIVTAPDGKVHQVPIAAGGRSFRGQFRCDRGKGVYQVEVTAHDAMGDAVLANFPVFCGVQPPAEAPRDSRVKQGTLSAPEAEKAMLALVNRDRAAAGRRPLVLDQRLSEVARAHSRDMAENDFVGHISPRTGDALARVQRAGLRPQLIMENVGRAYSAEETESGFMMSPGHRGNLLDSRVTRIGIGVAFGKPVTGLSPMFVTQLFVDSLVGP